MSNNFKQRFNLWATHWGEQVSALMGAVTGITYNEYPIRHGSRVWHGVCKGADGSVRAVIEFDRDDRYPGAQREYWLIRL